MSPDALNRITGLVIDAAVKVHKAFGPGLLESTYLACLCHDLLKAGLRVEREKPIPLVYGDLKITCAYRADILVEGCVIVEIKALESLAPVHETQMNTYLRVGDFRVGLILNFGCATMKEGIRRRVYNFPD